MAVTRARVGLPPIDYTSRDFQAIRADLMKAIPFFTPEWTDLNETDLGVVMLSLVSMVGDGLHYYVDRAANEAFIDTAINRKSAINLLRLINYRLRGPTPATVTATFTIEALGGNLVIPKGTRLETSSDTSETPIRFETDVELIILSGQTTGTVSATQGDTVTETAGTSTGMPNQVFALAQSPVIDGTVEVSVDEGLGYETWTNQDSFVSSTGADDDVVLNRDEIDAVSLHFGDNVQGRIPDALATIRATYRVGGGTIGNVGANTILNVLDTITYQGNPISISVNNVEAATGGEERETIEEGRILGPRSLRSLDRAVTLEDYATLASQYPGVARATAVVTTAGPSENSPCCCGVVVSVVPDGGGNPTNTLTTNLLSYLNDRRMIGTCISIANPSFVSTNVTANVFIATNFTEIEVATSVDVAINDFFDLTGSNVSFGQPVYMSDLIRAMDEIPGVDYVDLSEMTRSPQITYGVWAGTCTLGSVTVGLSGVDEVWTATMTSATTFSVSGSVSGAQTNTGTVGTAYVSDTGAIAFTITCTGVVAPCPGDRATIRVGRKMGNVVMDPTEIPEKGTITLTFAGGTRSQKVC